jgi:hypothetical protein
MLDIGMMITYAVGGTGRKTSVAFSADLLVTLRVSGVLGDDPQNRNLAEAEGRWSNGRVNQV